MHKPLSAIDPVEVPAQSLHPDWAEDWGRTLRQPKNRKAILDNARLAGRPSADLARQLDIPVLDHRMVEMADWHAFQTFARAPHRFLQIVGLANLAPYLAGIVSGEAVRALAAQFSLDDLRIAIACRDLAPAEAHEGVDPDHLGAIIADQGPKTVLNWAETLPPALRGRLRLMLPKRMMMPRMGENQPGVNHDPGTLIRRVAELLSPPGSGEKPKHDGW